MRHSRALAACGAAALVAAALAGPAGADSRSVKAQHTGQAENYLVVTKTAGAAAGVAGRLRARSTETRADDSAVNSACSIVAYASSSSTSSACRC